MSNQVVKLQKLDNLTFDNLKGFEKAAILVNYLGPNATKALLKRMDDGDDIQGYVRPWVDLTRDQIALLHADYPNPQGFALALQSKLKELNT
jgi:hypothetical protein